MDDDLDPLIGYQRRQEWMGTSVVTLADLWPEKPQALIVGLNPAPISVAAGHYYQGRSGQRQLLRLAAAGLFPPPDDGRFEEICLHHGVGFTDLVKRPTRGERDLSAAELAIGRDLLLEALAERHVPLVVCIFRQPADALMQDASTIGFQELRPGTRLFRMPGPFANRGEADDVMGRLARHLSSHSG